MTKRFVLLMLLAGHVASAQQNKIATFFPAAAVNSSTDGANNIKQLVGGYIAPIGEDFGSLSNNGWYTTAETHKKWGFDITVTANTVLANSDKKYFTPGNLAGVTYNGTTSAGNKAPTAYGPENEFPLFNYNEPSNPNIVAGAFRGPGGANISGDIPIGSLVVPTLQVGLGLFANTDLKVRFTPEMEVTGTQLKNWGVAVKHDLKQYIPGIKMAPFSLSFLFAYSAITATTDLSGLYSGSGQKGIGETTAYTAQILISKSIPVLTFYGGIGYNSSTTNYSIKGTYNVDKTGDGISLPRPATLTNPFSQDFTANGFRATGGLRIKFGPILFSGDYTYVNSKGLFTAGFGITVR